jgi:hypothetical protein
MQASFDFADDPHLQESRRANNARLRNAFAGIYDKYSKDFSGVGDEIDILTGNIVVDNGHIERMRDERDTGDQTKKFFKDMAHDIRRRRREQTARPLAYGNFPQQEKDDEDWEDVDELPSPAQSRHRWESPPRYSRSYPRPVPPTTNMSNATSYRTFVRGNLHLKLLIINELSRAVETPNTGLDTTNHTL